MKPANSKSLKSLLGMKMIGQHGSEIGVIKDMCVDVEAWQLLSLEVELKREASDALKL